MFAAPRRPSSRSMTKPLLENPRHLRGLISKPVRHTICFLTGTKSTREVCDECEWRYRIEYSE